VLRKPNVIKLHDEVHYRNCGLYCRLVQEQILRKMGIGIRVFIVNDDDSFQRLSLLKFQRLVRGDLNDRLEKLAGKRVRYVEVLLKIVNRNPKEILCIQYGFIHFDSKGLIDASKREEEVRLVLEALPSLPADVKCSKVILPSTYLLESNMRIDISGCLPQRSNPGLRMQY